MRKGVLTLICFFAYVIVLTAQKDNYLVFRAPFSTIKNDEFSPEYYKGGIVFCSNMGSEVFSGYATKDNRPFFRLYYADTTRAAQGSRIIEGDVNSQLNNGPATFSPNGDTIYFSRNLVVEGNYKEVTGKDNKLGLFFAVLKNGRWTNVTEMRFNDKSWNVTTPYLSPDGRRLYFASDKPDGLGGSDLYYSDWKNGYWDNPVNLGNIVNTEGNEAYPFVNEEGDLFFSSDGHKGKGGKDIFFTKFVDTAWISPVDLNPPVNSPANDFGFISDNLLSHGYFSSDRGKMLDIYSFKTIYPQFLYCYPQKSNNFCMTFSDDALIDIDPLTMKFQWDMGTGVKPSGYVVKNCFPGAGTYVVSEDIADKKTGRVILNKLRLEVKVRESALPGIVTGDQDVAGIPVKFSLTPMQQYEMLEYYWDFGDSEQGTGPMVSHTYSATGAYNVKFLAKIRNKDDGKLQQVCVSRMINVAEKGVKASNDLNSEEDHPNDNISFEKIYSASDEIARKAVFAVQVLNSEKKLMDNDPVFQNISSRYNIRRVIFAGEKNYSYLVAENTEFLSSYPALNDVISSGFNGASIRTYMPSDSGEIELWNFKRSYGTSSADFFVNNGTVISQHGITILDRLVLLLRRNPRMNLLIIAHSDSSTAGSLQLTTKQAHSIGDFLVNRGIDRSRIIPKGLGSAQPIAPEYPESVRLRNRRIDFISADDQ